MAGSVSFLLDFGFFCILNVPDRRMVASTAAFRSLTPPLFVRVCAWGPLAGLLIE